MRRCSATSYAETLTFGVFLRGPVVMSLPFVVTGQPNGLGDVAGLGRLVAAQEQQEESISAKCVVDAVARTGIDLQL